MMQLPWNGIQSSCCCYMVLPGRGRCYQQSQLPTLSMTVQNGKLRKLLQGVQGFTRKKMHHHLESVQTPLEFILRLITSLPLPCKHPKDDQAMFSICFQVIYYTDAHWK